MKHEPGIYHDVSVDEYLAWSALPGQVRLRITEPPRRVPQSEAMRIGAGVDRKAFDKENCR